MSKLAYRRYGDKLIHSGDPDNPIQVLHKAALLPHELDALAAFAEARLKLIDSTDEPAVPSG